MLITATSIAAAMLILWLLSIILRDVSIVDAFWGIGFAGVSWVSFAAAEPQYRSLLVPALTTVWGVRLSLHLLVRNHGKPEDYRYAAMREKHGARFIPISLVTVFGLQGLLMWLISLPLQSAQSEPASVSWLTFLGVPVFAVGLLFEAVGDAQLARFRADSANRGNVLQSGLWRYTRHPNYFGDFLVWWGLFLTAVGSGAPWWQIISPLTMSVLLMKISGVALLEKKLQSTRPGYAEYARRTNAFFPWSPRPHPDA